MTNSTRAQERSRVIAIIGGGFSGVVAAAQLLRQLPPRPARIVLVERSATLGCGVAYATRSFPYLLNVPAGRMSALIEDQAHLLGFAQQRVAGVTAHTFLPRQLYGEYLREVLRAAQAAAPSGVRLEPLHGETTAIHCVGAEGPLIVSVGTRQLLADQVVLACGDPPPAPKLYAGDLVGHSAYVVDPYAEPCFSPSDRAVLLIGTGLTMADVALVAAERHPRLNIVGLSRHGLLPHRQIEGSAAPWSSSQPLREQLVGLPLRALVHAVRGLARSARVRGGDWREVMARVREIVPQLWQALGEEDRLRFLRHVRTYWDIHRHRMPSAAADRVAELQRTGRLTVRAGCVTQLCPDGDRIVVLWRPRGRYDTQELWVDRVVECSGADRRLEHTRDMLWRQLLNDGLAMPDVTGIGVRTGKYGALIDIRGRASSRLFYLGPMLRAAHWEATAVGELRVHAQALAAALADESLTVGHVHMPKSRADLT